MAEQEARAAAALAGSAGATLGFFQAGAGAYRRVAGGARRHRGVQDHGRRGEGGHRRVAHGHAQHRRRKLASGHGGNHADRPHGQRRRRRAQPVGARSTRWRAPRSGCGWPRLRSLPLRRTNLWRRSDTTTERTGEAWSSASRSPRSCCCWSSACFFLFVPLLLGEITKTPKKPGQHCHMASLPVPGARDGGGASTWRPVQPAPPGATTGSSENARSQRIRRWAILAGEHFAAQADPLPEGWIRVAPNATEPEYDTEHKPTRRAAQDSLAAPLPTPRSRRCPLRPYATGSASRPPTARQWRPTRS